MTHRLIQTLESHIQSADVAEVQSALDHIHQAVMDGDDELINTLIQPGVITGLHQGLVARLGVNHRAMMLRKRATVRKQRALMFVKAMQNGVNRVGGP